MDKDNKYKNKEKEKTEEAEKFFMEEMKKIKTDLENLVNSYKKEISKLKEEND